MRNISQDKGDSAVKEYFSMIADADQIPAIMALSVIAGMQ
jgi:hypothetical protein